MNDTCKLCEVIDVLSNLIVVNVSQYLHISNHTVHLILTQRYLTIISQ